MCNAVKKLFNPSVSPVAASALAKKPANVIPICMAERKLLGSCSRSYNKAAFLLPSSTKIFILFLLAETTIIIIMLLYHI